MSLSTARLTPNVRRPLHQKARTCPYCGDRYIPIYGNSPTCTKPECRLQRNYEVSRKRKAERKAPVPIVICEVCGHPYKKVAKNRRTCGSANCQMELTRRRNRVADEGEPRLRRFAVCEVCGKSYLQLHKRRMTCSEECGVEMNRRRSAKNYRLKPRVVYGGKCGVCGAEFTSGFHKQKTCGSESCKKEWKSRLYREWLARNGGHTKVKKAARAKQTENRTMRECLTCETMFPSWGPGNRRCPKCEASIQSGGWDF